MVDRTEYWMFDTDDEDDTPADMPVFKRAQKSLIERFPQLPSVVEQFVKDNSAEAHVRRRDATAYTNGVSLTDIQRHVVANIPGLESISTMTIHRMLKPSRRRTINARRHTGVVDARIPAKRNNATTDHPDFRFTCASVNYTNELTQLYEDECISLSCDDKNKVNVGTLAVSRHFQINRFFSIDDRPNYPDHDFPHPNSKLIPSGYMTLAKRARTRSLSPTTGPRRVHRRRTRSADYTDRRGAMDRKGRQRVSWPRTGPLDVFLQAAMFHSSTSQMHADHLFEVLEPTVKDRVKPRTVVSIIADGGPDWSTKSLINLFNYGRLWRDLALDGLILVCYAPRHSRFNPIERAWGPLSKWLTGVTLPRTLEGEDNTPTEQRDLSDDDIVRKEAKIFDHAIDRCAKYWNGKTYDGYPIQVHTKPCIPTSAGRYSDHSELKAFVSASAAQIQRNATFLRLRQELLFLLDHSVRRTYQMEFYKCQRDSCSHCSNSPIRAKNFFKALSSFGGNLPTPVTDSSRCKGEYIPLLRLLDMPEWCSTGLDATLPSATRQRCDRGCRYVYVSDADRKRHQTLVHSRKL